MISITVRIKNLFLSIYKEYMMYSALICSSTYRNFLEVNNILQKLKEDIARNTERYLDGRLPVPFLGFN